MSLAATHQILPPSPAAFSFLHSLVYSPLARLGLQLHRHARSQLSPGPPRYAASTSCSIDGAIMLRHRLSFPATPSSVHIALSFDAT